MLETVDFSCEDLPKEQYKKQYKQLIEKLVVLQQQTRSKNIGLVVLFEGWSGAGKGSRISDLMYNLDARATSVHVTHDLEIQDAQAFAGSKNGVTGFFPFMQEFWQALGERGTITFYDRGWYTAAMQQVLYNMFGALHLPKDFEPQKPEVIYADSIVDFEQQLVSDGYLVVKFFVHVSKDGRKKHFEKLKKDPATAWRATQEKLARIGDYKDAYPIYDNLLERSNFACAPWTLINGENERAANVKIAETLVGALEHALDQQESPEEQAAASKALENSAAASKEAAEEGEGEGAGEASVAETTASTAEATYEERAREQAAAAPKHSRFIVLANYPNLDDVDHTLTLDEKTYHKRLKKLQKKLYALESEMYQRRIPLIAMYEGWDAAGKGGNIKRVAQALDARAYTIFPSPAPTRPELMHPHLWRYWTRLPKAGHVGIYDRSWYGRVLVERVEGFATTEQWARAYDEINEFERDLVEWGAILLKFWVDIHPDEQLKRFHARQQDPAKQWKITDEDWRNREKYPLYKAAAQDMFRLTSTSFAPWHILESDDKRYARIKALEIMIAALEERMG